MENLLWKQSTEWEFWIPEEINLHEGLGYCGELLLLAVKMALSPASRTQWLSAVPSRSYLQTHYFQFRPMCLQQQNWSQWSLISASLLFPVLEKDQEAIFVHIIHKHCLAKSSHMEFLIFPD